MTLNEFAKKHHLSTNWVRTLIKSKRLPGARMNTSGPVPYYEIPDGTPKPPSMQRSPQRLGTSKKVKPESIARRAYRAAEVKSVKISRPKTKTKAKVAKKA